MGGEGNVEQTVEYTSGLWLTTVCSGVCGKPWKCTYGCHGDIGVCKAMGGWYRMAGARGKPWVGLVMHENQGLINWW